MLCCFRMSLEHKDSFSVGAFHQVEFAQKNKKNCVAEMPVRVFLFASARAHSAMN